MSDRPAVLDETSGSRCDIAVGGVVPSKDSKVAANFSTCLGNRIREFPRVVRKSRTNCSECYFASIVSKSNSLIRKRFFLLSKKFEDKLEQTEGANLNICRDRLINRRSSATLAMTFANDPRSDIV